MIVNTENLQKQLEQERLFRQEAEHLLDQKQNELLLANERLQELDRLRAKLIRDITHELRTPVTSINLYIDLLERGREEKRPQYFKALREQTGRLASLIDDAFAFSSTSMPAQAEPLQRLNLQNLLKEQIDMMQPRANLSRLALSYNPRLGCCDIIGNKQQLSDMIKHLLTNAIYFTNHGTIQVTARCLPESGQAELTIIDTGIGIGPDELPRVFEHFYRGKAVSERKIPGLGLGLTLTREIVRLHSGEIKIDSEVDHGTTVTICLPLVPA